VCYTSVSAKVAIVYLISHLLNQSTYIYIYIEIERERERESQEKRSIFCEVIVSVILSNIYTYV
jgi:hypothetical protein